MKTSISVELDEELATKLLAAVERERTANPATRPNRSSIVRAALIDYFARGDAPTVRARSR